jgi:aminobenzoyl-glutamate utilization protein B
MMLRVLTIAVAVLTCWARMTFAANEEMKRTATDSIDAQAASLIEMSDRIWRLAETALREYESSQLLADFAEQQGFTVKRGVAGMPTAFVASYGSGEPVLGVLGEFDALPGLSQKAIPRKEPQTRGAAGHACGHNLFGPASLGAATAIKQLITEGKLRGTIRFFGTPAEEAVGGKIYMARDGVFDDLDVCLAWHPSDKTQSDMTSSQAMVDFIVEFRGKAAHAAHDPWNGRSAVDGLELMTHGLNMMREHIRPSSRIHYTIVKGGDVPNVIPEYARLWCWVRDWKRSEVDQMLERVRQMAEGAALMAGVDATVTVQTGDYEMLVNETGQRLLHENLLWLGPIEYTPEEQAFAKAIQKATGKEQKGLNGTVQPLVGQLQEGGSSDVGDVSWLVPTLHVSVTTAPEDTPWHSWPVVACGGMSIGHKGMLHAAKTLTATMIDLYQDPAVRREIRQEFAEKTKGHQYKAYIPDGPPPVPFY